MPARSEHLQQAGENRAHAEMLLREHRSDRTSVQWAVTAVFYCAVHCVEAYLADQRQHSMDHRHRDSLLDDPAIGFPVDARDAYQQLKQWSQSGRYLMGGFTFDPRVRPRPL